MKKALFFYIFVLTLAFLPVHFSNAAEPTTPKVYDNEVWGAQYGNVKEARMNLAVGSRVYAILEKDKRFQVFITRDINGYTQNFAEYFTDKRQDIISFKELAKTETLQKILKGVFVQKENVPHNTATQDASVILYGINKWANENNIDAVIHIHFNDYPRVQKWTIGKYGGFVIYFPDGELANSKESGNLAADIFTQLRKKYKTSTYEKELGGLVADQNLIAVGANGTLNASVRSVLIEYGYIYEKKFRNYTTRHQAYKDMAELTVQGVKNYFFPKSGALP